MSEFNLKSKQDIEDFLTGLAFYGTGGGGGSGLPEPPPA